jgi:hypothetical protein
VLLEAASKALSTNYCAARFDIVSMFWRKLHEFSGRVLRVTGIVDAEATTKN